MVGNRFWRKWVQGIDLWALALIAVMLVNVIALGRLNRFAPGGTTAAHSLRMSATALGDYYAQAAEQQGLAHNQAVRDALAKYRFEAEQASTEAAVAQAMSTYGLAIVSVLARELQHKGEQTALAIIAQEAGLTGAPEGATVFLRPGEGGLEIEDHADILSVATIERLQRDPDLGQLRELAQIQIQNGKPRLLPTRSQPAQIEALREELDRAQAGLKAARESGGFAELSGPGIVISARQSQAQALLGSSWGYDLRDVINELYAAGARGIQVGPERLIVTSSIRDVADALLVNHQQVAVNPLQISVVGDPAVLASALDLITSTPYFGLSLDIEQKDQITLVAHPWL